MSRNGITPSLLTSIALCSGAIAASAAAKGFALET
jgi:hypothetical protein